MTSYTQFRNGRKKEICDMVIGVDFGTSCTKMVIRSPFRIGGRAYAVHFGSVSHPSSPYLLPSALWVDKRGQVSLSEMQNGFYLRDIKYHLMRAEPVVAISGPVHKASYDAESIAVAFLAKALRYARKWFMETQQALYSDFRLRWAVNLGLPSADYADTVLCERYRRIASAAWYLSLSDGSITLELANKALAEFMDWNPTDAVDAEVKAIPEVAAEVVGYARSPLRDEGLHMLVDIGASTLDVCSFILHEKDGDDCYELLTADVQELGAMVLYRTRLECVREYTEQYLNKLWRYCDPVSPIPDKVTEYRPPHSSLKKEYVKSDDEYRRRCFRAVWNTLVEVRTRRYPRAPRWRDEFPVFIAGGASEMPSYRQMIDSVSERLKELYQGCQGLCTLSLRKPESLQADVNDNDYHRLAVAWGLSFPDTDIGSVTRPAEISDVPPRDRTDWQDRFVRKEDV